MEYIPPIGAAPGAPYVDANPQAGIEGSPVPAAALEHDQREIVVVIESVGLAPSSGNLTQLNQAIDIKIATQVPAATTALAGRVELATNAEAQALIDATRAITPAALASVTATETRTGIAEIATQAEADAGLDNARFITPLRLAGRLGVANGIATLDGGGKIPSAQLPPIAMTNVSVVANQAAMLALVAEVGDVAVRSDLSKSFMLRVAPANVLANWQELLTPTNTVLSVFGRTGSVAAAAGDYSATQITNAPSGNIAAVTVQAALAELDAEKAHLAAAVNTFSGALEASEFRFAGDTDTSVAHPGENQLAFFTGAAEAMRIDSGRRVLIGGNSTNGILGLNLSLQIQAATLAPTTGSGIAIQNFVADGSFPVIYTFKSRSGAIGAPGIVQNGDTIAALDFGASDGVVASMRGAAIRAIIDGAPAAGALPTRLAFLTAGSAGNPVERLTVAPSGNVGIGIASPTQRLDVAGTINASDYTQGGQKLQTARVWVNFNGVGTVAIRDSYNVSSVTDNGVGDYTINFATALANNNYAWATGWRDAGNNIVTLAPEATAAYASDITAASFRARIQSNDATRIDIDALTVIIFGD